MKTDEQILERINSPEIIDLFDTQKVILISFLSFDAVKPFLNENYVTNYENLPEDEKWNVEDPKEKLMEFLPALHKVYASANFMEARRGLLVLRTLIWLIDDDFFTEIDPFFSEFNLDEAEEVIKKISNHFGYKPTIEDISFEEIPE